MNSSPLTLPTDRLIDYFCVCGPGDELAPVADGAVSYATASGRPHPTRTEFLPRLLDRFPALDYPDTPFPTGVADFCFPNQVRLVRPRRGQPEPLPAAFAFIATGAKGERLVGHVLVFWEALSPAQAACVDPLAPAPSPTIAAATAAAAAASTASSSSSSSSTSSHALVGAPSERPPSDSSAVMTPVLDDAGGAASSGGAGDGEGLHAEPAPTPADARTVIVRSASADSAFSAGTGAAAAAATLASSDSSGDGLPAHDGGGGSAGPSAPRRSSSAGAATGEGSGGVGASTSAGDAGSSQVVAQRGSRGAQHKAPLTVYAPKCICLLSRWAFPAFRTLLTEFYRLSLTAQALPLERLVVNFTCEIALPPAGRVEVLYPIGSQTLVFKRPPKNRRVSAMNLPFREVFEALDLHHVVALVRAVLLERQILLVSSQLSLLTATAEVVGALIYPFRWCHTAIPVMPKGMVEVLNAPTPYLLGLHVEAWREVAATIPPGVIQVDLDRNRITVTGESPANSGGFWSPQVDPHEHDGAVLDTDRSDDASAGGGDGGGDGVAGIGRPATLSASGGGGSGGGPHGGSRASLSARSTSFSGLPGGVAAAPIPPGPDLDSVLPQVPDKQRRKLLRALQMHADVFARRPADWIFSRLPQLDSAFSFASRPDELDEFAGGGYGGAGGEGGADEGASELPDSDDDERGPAAMAPGRIQHTLSGGVSFGGGGGGSGSNSSRGLDATASMLLSPLRDGGGSGGGNGTGAGGRPLHRVNWGATRRAFFRVFVSLLLRYRDHLVYPSLENPFPRSRFAKEAFLRESPPEARPFLSALMETQAFANFIDDRIQPEAASDVDVEFFDQSVDAKANRSRFTFTKRETPFLSSTEFAITKSVVALSPDATGLPAVGGSGGSSGGAAGRVYSPFPAPLEHALFYPPREIPSYADKLSPGLYQYHALRRSGVPLSPLQRLALQSLGGGGGGQGGGYGGVLISGGGAGGGLPRGGRPPPAGGHRGARTGSILAALTGGFAGGSSSDVTASGGGMGFRPMSARPGAASTSGAAAAANAALGIVGGSGPAPTQLPPDAHVYRAWFLAFTTALDFIATEVARRAGEEFDSRELAAAAAQQASQLAALRAATATVAASAAFAAASASRRGRADGGGSAGSSSRALSPGGVSRGRLGHGGVSASGAALSKVIQSALHTVSSDSRRDRSPSQARREGSVAAALSNAGISTPTAVAAAAAARNAAAADARAGSVAATMRTQSGSSVPSTTPTTTPRAGGSGAGSGSNVPSLAVSAVPPPRPLVRDASAPTSAPLSARSDGGRGASPSSAPAGSAPRPSASPTAAGASSSSSGSAGSGRIAAAAAALSAAPATQPPPHPQQHQQLAPRPTSGGRLGGGHRRQPTTMRREQAVTASKAAFFASQLELAYAVYGRMRDEGYAPDELIFSSLLELCGRAGDYDRARYLVTDMVGSGFEQDAALHRLLFTTFFASNPDAATAAGLHSLPSLNALLYGGSGGGGASSSSSGGGANGSSHALMGLAHSPGPLTASPAAGGAGTGPSPAAAGPPHASGSGGGGAAAHGHGLSHFPAGGASTAGASRKRALPTPAVRPPGLTSYVIDGDTPLPSAGFGGAGGASRRSVSAETGETSAAATGKVPPLPLRRGTSDSTGGGSGGSAPSAPASADALPPAPPQLGALGRARSVSAAAAVPAVGVPSASSVAGAPGKPPLPPPPPLSSRQTSTRSATGGGNTRSAPSSPGASSGASAAAAAGGTSTAAMLFGASVTSAFSRLWGGEPSPRNRPPREGSAAAAALAAATGGPKAGQLPPASAPAATNVNPTYTNTASPPKAAQPPLPAAATLTHAPTMSLGSVTDTGSLMSLAVAAMTSPPGSGAGGPRGSSAAAAGGYRHSALSHYFPSAAELFTAPGSHGSSGAAAASTTGSSNDCGAPPPHLDASAAASASLLERAFATDSPPHSGSSAGQSPPAGAAGQLAAPAPAVASAGGSAGPGAGTSLTAGSSSQSHLAAIGVARVHMSQFVEVEGSEDDGAEDGNASDGSATPATDARSDAPLPPTSTAAKRLFSPTPVAAAPKVSAGAASDDGGGSSSTGGSEVTSPQADDADAGTGTPMLSPPASSPGPIPTPVDGGASILTSSGPDTAPVVPSVATPPPGDGTPAAAAAAAAAAAGGSGAAGATPSIIDTTTSASTRAREQLTVAAVNAYDGDGDKPASAPAAAPAAARRHPSFDDGEGAMVTSASGTTLVPVSSDGGELSPASGSAAGSSRGGAADTPAAAAADVPGAHSPGTPTAASSSSSAGTSLPAAAGQSSSGGLPFVGLDLGDEQQPHGASSGESSPLGASPAGDHAARRGGRALSDGSDGSVVVNTGTAAVAPLQPTPPMAPAVSPAASPKPAAPASELTPSPPTGLAAVTIHSTIVDRPPTDALTPPASITRQLGVLRLTQRFPGLFIDLLRETCPACDRPLSDADIRSGWSANDEQSYTTVCPTCPPVASPSGALQRRSFVARFVVTSSSPLWRGSTRSGPGAPLFCEYLPPAVLVKELQQAVAHGQVGPYLRVKSPTLFWNLLLWSVQLALPAEMFSFLAREVSEDARPTATATGAGVGPRR